MRRKLIAANWKMYKNTAQVRDFFAQLGAMQMPADRDMVIAASFPLLPAVVSQISAAQLPIMPAAQNLFYEDEGAFTGEVSASQLRDIGVQAVILGHSERRRLFGETNEMLNKKLKSAIKNNLFPIFALGESADERAAGKAKAVVQQQLEEGLHGLSDQEKSQIAIAYEPVWAIGTGNQATPEQAEEILAFIRTFLPDQTRILYGGSVNPQNAATLLQQPSVDGFLIGGASLDPASFYAILTA